MSPKQLVTLDANQSSGWCVAGLVESQSLESSLPFAGVIMDGAAVIHGFEITVQQGPKKRCVLDKSRVVGLGLFGEANTRKKNLLKRKHSNELPGKGVTGC